MKVSIITRHGISNYGSLLQTIATQKILEKLGCSCEIIDYIRDDEHYKNIDRTILKNKTGWNNNFIKRLIYLTIRVPASIIAGRKFESMRKQYLKLSMRYNSKEALLRNKPNADMYLTGSDQVWGAIGSDQLDESYFLSFCDNSDNKFAYAASFGKTNISPINELNYKKLLSTYNSIGVREESAKKIIEDIGLESVQVLDPTFLLTPEEWLECIGTKINEKIASRGYVLIYQLHKNDEVFKYAKYVANKMGWKVLRISPSFHQCTWGGKFIYLPKIEEFLWYIKNASCMITDSFHGTAFAINLNTPFVEVLPQDGSSTRNISILQLTNLSSRIVNSKSKLNVAFEPIDYENVNRIIAEEREKSIDYLRNIVRLSYEQ